MAQLGCATYQSQVTEARNSMATAPAEAATKLEPLATKDSKDQLVYLLDYATALQAAGIYKDSSKAFIAADKMAEMKDYVSISQEVGSLLFAQEMVQYKGEDFEKLLINSLGAINYVLMGDIESALVETRRSIEKLNFYRVEQKKEYGDNSFVHYLNGHMWEANRNYDSAYIDFKKAYDMGVRHRMIEQDLLRVAIKGNKGTDIEKLRKQFAAAPDMAWKIKNNGELLVVYQQGWGPRKQPNPEYPRFPVLVRENAYTRAAAVEIDGSIKGQTYVVYDLAAAAIKNLDDQYTTIIAKHVAGLVAKEVVAKGVGKKNEGAGILLYLAMHASDRADLRQWSTLPNSIQMARFDLPAGTHKLRFIGLSEDGTHTNEDSQPMDVVIKPARKSFVGWRSYR